MVFASELEAVVAAGPASWVADLSKANLTADQGEDVAQFVLLAATEKDQFLIGGYVRTRDMHSDGANRNADCYEHSAGANPRFRRELSATFQRLVVCLDPYSPFRNTAETGSAPQELA
jgi:hypothetical protein